MLQFVFRVFLLLAVSGQVAAAHEIKAIAASPDGSTLLVAGDNRVLYTLDAASLEVRRRSYMPEQVDWMRYSADGRLLYVLARDQSFAAYDAVKFKRRFGTDKIVAAAYAPRAGRLALLERKFRTGIVHVLDAADGAPLRSIELPDLQVRELAITDDGGRALLLTQSARSETEETAQPGSELSDYDKRVFRQQHDGYASVLVTADLNTGTHEVAETWFRVTEPSQVRMLGDAAVFVKTASDTAVVAPDGTATLVNLGEGFVSFARIGNDGRTVVVANGRKIRVHRLQSAAAGETLLELEADSLPGPGERVEAMAEAADGTLYFGTSAYRIWKVEPGGAGIVAAPVF